MRRVVVLGGYGFFGGTIVERLRAMDISPLIGSRRRNAELVLDVEDRESLCRSLRPGDVVVDAVGPFQARSTTLVEAAVEIGFDVVDIADSLAYVEAVHQLSDRIDQAGIRIFTACSSISAITAAMVRISGIDNPVRITGLLVPAARYTAVAATAASLMYSVGRPIRLFEAGEVVTRCGWRKSRSFALPPPIGSVTGYLVESADSLTLPSIWPSLRTVDLYVSTNVLGLNALLRAAARSSTLRNLVDRFSSMGLKLSRHLGGSHGALSYEIETRDGDVRQLSLISGNRGYIVPVAPAVLAVRALVENRAGESGLVPPNRQIDPDELIRYLQRFDIKLSGPS